MSLLNVIDLDKIWPVNSMWENKFFEPRVKVGTALVWNLWENQNEENFLKNEKKTQIIE